MAVQETALSAGAVGKARLLAFRPYAVALFAFPLNAQYNHMRAPTVIIILQKRELRSERPSDLPRVVKVSSYRTRIKKQITH